MQAIHRLLGGQAQPHWGNLGTWQQATNYDTACQALAMAHGDAVGLCAEDRLIELASGGGAGLALWASHYGVQQIQALELKPTQIETPPQANLQAGACDLQIQPVKGRFDRLPLPNALLQQRFSALICVDAAYHASSMADFLAVAHALLESQGRMAFSTIFRPPDQTKPHASDWRLRFAGIPARSHLTAHALQQQLQADWHSTRITPLPYVFSGFCQHVQARAKQLTMAQKLSPSWLKIAATAKLCAHLDRQGNEYALVQASKR